MLQIAFLNRRRWSRLSSKTYPLDTQTSLMKLSSLSLGMVIMKTLSLSLITKMIMSSFLSLDVVDTVKCSKLLIY